MAKKKNYKNINTKQIITSLIILIIMIIIVCLAQKVNYNLNNVETNSNIFGKTTYSSLENIPEYTGEICVKINDNKPYFNEEDYFNTEGMLPNERLVLEYIKKNPNNHVLYRVTPIFKGENLLATGVEMEAYSVEDNGKFFFNVFVYNIQPGAKLNYATGELLND